MGVEILPGTAIFQNQIRQMQKRCSNFTPAFSVIDRSWMRFESNKFANLGPGWQPEAQATTDRKEVYGNPPLMVRGEPGHTEGQGLRASLTTHGDGSIFEMTPLSIQEGTSISYAQWHQSGTEHMPRRSLMPVFSQLTVQWFAILQSYFLYGAATASVVGAAASQA